MEVNVQVDPEQINKMVAEAVLQSAIGEQIQKAVDEVTQAYSSTYDNPIKQVVKKLVDKAVYEEMSAQFFPLIKQRVTNSLSDELVSDLIDKAWKALINRF